MTAGDEMLTLAEVDALTGDDIAYWLSNPFVPPEQMAEKVRWWVTRALAARLEPIEALAEKWNSTPDYDPTEYDRGRVEQRLAMTTELLEALAPATSEARL